MANIHNFGDYFLLGALGIAFYFAFVILKPFFTVIFVAAVLAILFYPLYTKLLAKLKRPSISALSVCFIVVAIIVLPMTYFVFSLTTKSIEAYTVLDDQLRGGLIEKIGIEEKVQAWQEGLKELAPSLSFEDVSVRQIILDWSDEINSFLVSSTTGLIRGTSNILLDFFLIIFSLYYFLKEGPRWLSRVMNLTPLSNKYDLILFTKFREVSIQSVLVTLLISIVQGIIGAIGFLIVGVPAFFLGVLMAFFSLMPFVGSFLVWFPASLILIAIGRWEAGLFLFFYGLIVVSTIDNVLRAFLMRGKAQVHELWIFFSVLGGIAAFGFWGIVYGPLILAITLTLIHIYELEFGTALSGKGKVRAT